jgi:hypothetical protein
MKSGSGSKSPLKTSKEEKPFEISKSPVRQSQPLSGGLNNKLKDVQLGEFYKKIK